MVARGRSDWANLLMPIYHSLVASRQLRLSRIEIFTPHLVKVEFPIFFTSYQGSTPHFPINYTIAQFRQVNRLTYLLEERAPFPSQQQLRIQ